MDILISILKAILETILPKKKIAEVKPEVLREMLAEPEPIELAPVSIEYKFQWGTKEDIRHSIRVICDEMGMTVEQKNTMCATIYGESEFNLHARNENKRDGKVTSIDLGLCQWNTYYHGKEITPIESINNPEKAVRLMAKYWLRGQRDLWIAYKSGSFRRYIDLVQHPM